MAQERGTRSPETARNEDQSNGMNCPICYEQYTSTGEHIVISLKCGHVMGNSCVRTWFNTTPPTAIKKCPICNDIACVADIRRIYTNNIIVVNNPDNTSIALIEAELRALQHKLAGLKAIGIDYIECPICDYPFITENAKCAHINEKHMAH